MSTLNYLTRVAQVDALKLDNEIIEIFKRQISELLQYVPAGLATKYDPEITLILRLFMFNHSLIKNRATFGQQLLAIKYDNMSNNKLLLYGILTHGVNYIKDRIHTINSEAIHDFNVTKLLDRLEGLLLLVNLINFLNFLRTGEKPSLVDRILDLKQTSTVKRYLNNNIYSFMQREILWHTFIELLLIVLPLINYHSWVRRFKNLSPWNTNSNQHHIEAPRVFTITTKCPNCNEKPVLPHHMGCSHIFCYYCLKGNLEADTGYQCPVCNFSGQKCLKFYM
ncbi:peroxisome biogenesis factor 2 [Chrysoperla carnea]|uniref:peroxisome biogenesis factor 2 n=1 Tax=Chrysoperla carnea TaxID=189513 RepID=UPI001D099977|nr:peroxisome biogenesis factor 2 [Chrysoperla carnea]